MTIALKPKGWSRLRPNRWLLALLILIPLAGASYVALSSIRGSPSTASCAESTNGSCRAEQSCDRSLCALELSCHFAHQIVFLS